MSITTTSLREVFFPKEHLDILGKILLELPRTLTNNYYC